MFLQETQTQVKHIIYLAWLYLSISLLSSSDTVTLHPSIVNAEWKYQFPIQTFQH